MENNLIANSARGKSNKAFMILSALGIIFVVDAHLWSRMSFFTYVFPYDSFFMPMFIFISGYFFKEKYIESMKSVVGFLKNKVTKLLLPYFGWIVFYGVLTYVLTEKGILNYQKWDIVSLIKNIFFVGTSFGLNSPSWFVPVLFIVSVIYVLARKIFNKIWNESVAMAVLFALGTISVYFSSQSTLIEFELLTAKTFFFLQFYELGIFFKKYLEKWFDKINTLALLSICICINFVLLSIYGTAINFFSCAFMGGFKTNNVFLPMITTLTGTAFWLKISKLIAPLFGDNKFVNFISNNTFFIMTHHLTAKALFNGLLIIGKKFGIEDFTSVNAVEFKNNAWYVFNSVQWVWTAGFFFTLVVTLIACFFYNNGKGLLKKQVEKIAQKNRDTK